MSEQTWTVYRKTGLVEMRPYIPGEDLTNVSVNKEDEAEIENGGGGMIARNSENHADKWYVAKAYFDANYEAAKG